MDTGLHPLLLDNEVYNADVNCPGCLDNQVPMLEKALKGGGRGGDTKDATGLHVSDLLDPGVTDARCGGPG